MTIRGLLDALAAFIKEDLKEMLLPVNPEEQEDGQPLFRPVEVYKQRMPRPSDTTTEVPYILLWALNGKDDIKNGNNVNTIEVRAVITVYERDAAEGALALMNIVEKLRFDLQSAGIVGKRFKLERPFEFLFYPDETAPYHTAELLTVWSVPPVERKVPELHW